MQLRYMAVIDRLRESLWVLPAAGLLLAFALSFVLRAVDQALGQQANGWFIFGGGAEGARVFLGTIAGAVLTLTALVFSITMLVLQLASSQLSPRVLRTFLGDRQTQAVLGLGIATFTFALLVLREVRDDFVPGVSTWAAFVVAIATVGGFIYFVDHIAQSIRVSTIVDRIARETLKTIERLHPEALEEGAPAATPGPQPPDGPPDWTVRWDRRSAVLAAVDQNRLAELCEKCSTVISLTVQVGDLIPRGAVVASVWGPSDELEPEMLLGAVSASLEPSMEQDVSFGLQQLLNIANRALSPGVNDPDTALQVADQVHDLLSLLMGRVLPSVVVCHAREGTPLVFWSQPDWATYVSLAFNDLRFHGRNTPAMLRRLRSLLDDLEERAPGVRLAALAEQRRLLDASVQQLPAHEQAVASQPDPRGLSDRGEPPTGSA